MSSYTIGFVHISGPFLIERTFILKRTEVFGGLSHDVLGILAAHMEEARLSPGEALFAEGEVGQALYVVVEGRIRMHRDGETLVELGPDSVIGEVTALTSEVRTVSATAMDECRLLLLGQDVLYELMAGRPAISRALIKVLVERLT